MSDGNPFKTPRKQLSMSSLPVASQSNAAGDEYTKQLEKMVDQYKKDFEGEYLKYYISFLSVCLSVIEDRPPSQMVCKVRGYRLPKQQGMSWNPNLPEICCRGLLASAKV